VNANKIFLWYTTDLRAYTGVYFAMLKNAELRETKHLEDFCLLEKGSIEVMVKRLLEA
jgi:hypothetical protein